MKITDSVYYIGVDDETLDLFESQYIIPNGVSYNSYVIMDEKIAVMDTVDGRATEEWIKNLEEVLDGKKPAYLIVSHMEPDHSANTFYLMQKYPEMQIVLTDKALKMTERFFDKDFSEKAIVVTEGMELSLGEHTLKFFMAPMVHWPEVMVTYDIKDKILFSADGFGKFGALSKKEDWTCEARRYYFNIVGKYGVQVQALLKKAKTLNIEKICPLHGPILTENLSYYIEKYDIWSSYKPEDDGVLVACASIHGNTMKAAKRLVQVLEQKGAEKVVLTDLSRDDMAEAIEDAFRYDKLVVAASSYDAGVFPPMEDFIAHLKSKAYQNRKVAIIENGSWAPSAGKIMKAGFEAMKNITVCENMVTINSVMKETDVEKLEVLADELLK